MDEATETKQIVLGMLQFLNQECNKPSVTSDSKESIEVAMQCLETAFNTNLREDQYKGKTGLREMFANFHSRTHMQIPLTPTMMNALQGDLNAANPIPGLLSSGFTLGVPYEPPPEALPEQKAFAEEQKTLGNEHMKNGSCENALIAYSEAIKADGRNAVYFCNRAAAYQKLNKLDDALRDCQVACQLQPNYARAYGRMGVTYSTLGDHLSASACYGKAVELDPTNESYVNNLKVADELIAAGRGGSGDGAGTPVTLQALFNNPSLINMASQMLQDPAMQTMMRAVMSEYQPQGENVNMEGLLQVGQAMANQIRQTNPDLVDQIQTRLNTGAQPPSDPNSNPGPDQPPNSGQPH